MVGRSLSTLAPTDCNAGYGEDKTGDQGFSLDQEKRQLVCRLYGKSRMQGRHSVTLERDSDWVGHEYWEIHCNEGGGRNDGSLLHANKSQLLHL